MCKKVWALSEQVMRGYRARASTRADGRTDRQSLLKSSELTKSNKDISEHKTTAQTRLTFQTIEIKLVHGQNRLPSSNRVRSINDTQS